MVIFAGEGGGVAGDGGIMGVILNAKRNYVIAQLRFAL